LRAQESKLYHLGIRGLIGLSEAAQDISFEAMAERQQALINAVVQDPAVATVGSAVGAGGGNTTE
jgi:HAE1 family hydrophobic/amphiphilic exporter-1